MELELQKQVNDLDPSRPGAGENHQARTLSIGRRVSKAIVGSNAFQATAAFVLHGILSFIYRSNRPVEASQDLKSRVAGHSPAIIALWHGQQMLVHLTRPEDEHVAGLVSKSADAEIMARVLLRSGNEVVRGSGGRNRSATLQKGGVGALVALKRALARGRHVVMIADISKGHPRQAGQGIVRLARMTGRPIVPMALATSRRHVVKKAWDKMAINLPFGRRCLRLGEPIYVDQNTPDEEIAQIQKKVTTALQQVTDEAYEFVDGQS